MGNLYVRVFIIVACIFPYQSHATDELAFPNQKQRQEIASKLLLGIESIDAITIELRNKTRQVDWGAYKALTSQNIINATDWLSLNRAIANLHYGILNRHSYLLVDESISDKADPTPRWPAIELGYTWPDVSFFSTINSKSIQSINNRNIQELFDEFFNLYCNDVHVPGCLRLFSRYMKAGYFFLGGAEHLVVGYEDGSTETLAKTKKVKPNKKEPIDCATMYSSLHLNLVYDGNQSCL